MTSFVDNISPLLVQVAHVSGQGIIEVFGDVC